MQQKSHLKSNNIWTSDQQEQLIIALNHSAIVSATNSKGEIISTNEAFSALSGYSETELLGKSHRVLKSDVHPVAFYKNLWETISNGKTWKGEICNKKKNGNSFWIDTTIIPLKNEKLIIDKYVAICYDITQRKETETTLTTYENLFDVSDELRCVTNRDGYIERINDAFANILGYTKERLLNTSLFDLMHPDDIESTQYNIGNLNEKNSTLELHNRLKTSNGKYRWLSWNTIVDKTTGKLYASAKDNTDTQKAELILQKTFRFTALNFGKNYFHSLCEFLTLELNVKFAFVGQYINEQLAVKSNAFYCDGQSLPPLTYSVKNTPCNVVITEQYCMYSSDVQSDFPKDEDLVTLGVHSYMGIPLLSENGETIGIISIMHDEPIASVDEKEKIFKMVAKRTEGELQQHIIQQQIIDSEQQKKDIINSIPDVIFIVDKEGNYLDCLVEDESRLIAPWAELKNKNKRDFLPKKIADYILKKIKIAIRTNTVQVAEYELSIKQEVSHYESRIVKTSSNTVMQIIRDVTDVKLAVGAVMKSEQKFHSLFNTASDGIFIIDKNEKSIIEVNETAALNLGYQPKELIGKKIEALYSEGSRKFIAGKINTLGTDDNVVFETQQLKKDGSLLDVEISSTRFNYDNKDVFQSFVRDISIRKETERRQAVAFKIADIASRRLMSLVPLCELIHQEIATIVRANNLVIALVNENKTTIKFPYFSGENFDEMVYEITHSDTKIETARKFDKNRLVEQVCLSSKTLYIKDYTRSTNKKIKRDSEKETTLKSWLGIPLKSEGKTIGVLALQDFESFDAYSKKDIHFMEFIASQIGGVIEKQDMFNAIYESEVHYKSMIENSSDISFLISNKKTVTYISSSVNKVLGYPPTAIIGSKIADFALKSERNEINSAIEKALKNSNYTVNMEVHTRHINGNLITMAVVGNRKKNINGEYEIIINAHDITARKAYERQIHDSNEQLKFSHKLFERVLHNDDISNILRIALLGIRKNIKHCNRVSVGLFDLENNEAVFISKDSPNNSKISIGTKVKLKENFRSLDSLKKGIPFYCKDVTSVKKKSKSDIILLDEGIQSYYVYPLMDNDKLIGSINIGSSITEFLRDDNKSFIEEYAYNICLAIIYPNLYKDLKQSENKLNRLLHAMDEAVFQVDKNGGIQYVNPKAKLYFDIAQKETLLNNNIDQLIEYNPSLYSNCMEYLADIAKRDNSYRQIILPYSKSTTKWGLLNITLLTEKGKLSGAIVLVTDITDSVKKEEVRRKTIIEGEENERKRLAHDLHDGLGQTIAAANMYVNSLEHKLKDKLTETEWGQLLKAKELVNKAVLETRTISHNIMPRSLQEFGLSQTIEELSNNISAIHEKIRIKFTPILNGKRFENDIELGIYRATQEIINNAVKHSQANNLEIILMYRSGHIILKTIDDGIGISKKIQSKGLGLESLKNRVEALKGTFELFSMPNEGTKMKIKIPTKILSND